MPYHPPQRAVSGQLLCVSRWIRGTFHLPKLHSFEEHLKALKPFVPLTEVDLGAGPLPFLALRVSSIHAIAPEGPEALLHLLPVPGVQERSVSCYLENVAIHGTLDLKPGIRTSDFLGHQEGFFTLRRCRVVPAVPGRAEPIPVLLVNARAVIAVAEEGSQAEAPAVEAAEGEGA